MVCRMKLTAEQETAIAKRDGGTSEGPVHRHGETTPGTFGNSPKQIGKRSACYRNLPFDRRVKVPTFATETRKSKILETKYNNLNKERIQL